MELEVVRGNNHKQNLIIDYLKIRLNEITPQEIMEYQNIFGKIISENHNDFRFIFSDLLNREDGTTHLLDSIVKYIECVKLLENNSNNITIINLDSIIFNCLVNYCKEKNIKIKKRKKTFLFFEGLKIKFLFIIRFFIMYFTNTIILCYSKVSLKNSIKNYKAVFISYFDYRSVSSCEYKDPFFHRLQEKYSNDNIEFGTVVILMYQNILTGLRYIKDIKNSNNKNIVTLFNLLKPFQLLISYLKALNYKITINDDIYFSNYSITHLINKKLNIEYYSGSKQFSIERFLIINLLEYKNLEVIYYPFENFSWEKMLCKRKNENNLKVNLIGFQHTSFSLKLMHHFPSFFESKLNIYPDKLLTTGKITKQLLLDHGFFPENLIETGCALRHEYLENYLIKFRPVNNIFNRIAFAFSFDITRYDFIINNLLQQFTNPNIEIILKFHPLNQDYIPKVKFLPSNFKIGTSLSWNSIFESIDVLIYEGNSICIDALANNIPAIYYPFTGNLYNTNQLYNYDWKYTNTNKFEDFSNHVLEIINSNIKSNHDFFEYNKSYVNSYFEPITSFSLNKFIIKE